MNMNSSTQYFNLIYTNSNLTLYIILQLLNSGYKDSMLLAIAY